MKITREKLHSTAVSFVSVTNEICAHHRFQCIHFVRMHEHMPSHHSRSPLPHGRRFYRCCTQAQTHTNVSLTDSIVSYNKTIRQTQTRQMKIIGRALARAFKCLNLCTIIIILAVGEASNECAECIEQQPTTKFAFADSSHFFFLRSFIAFFVARSFVRSFCYYH